MAENVLDVDNRIGSFGIEDVVKERPDGSKIKIEKVDADMILIHVSVPAEMQIDSIKSWHKRFREVLPENAYATILPDNIDLKVNRPRETILNFEASTFESKDVMQSIKKAFEMTSGGGKITLNFKDCKFMKKRKGVEKDGTGEESKITTP